MRLEPSRERREHKLARTAVLDLGVDRPRLLRWLKAACQPLELTVDHDAAAELEDVRRGPDQSRTLKHAALTPAGVQDDLHIRSPAGLERPDAHMREPAVGSAEQRRSRSEQGSVQIDVKTAHRAGDRTITRRVSIAGETWTELLEQGRADERLVHEGLTRARRPHLVPLPDDLSPPVAHALDNVGIT